MEIKDNTTIYLKLKDGNVLKKLENIHVITATDEFYIYEGYNKYMNMILMDFTVRRIDFVDEVHYLRDGKEYKIDMTNLHEKNKDLDDARLYIAAPKLNKNEQLITNQNEKWIK